MSTRWFCSCFGTTGLPLFFILVEADRERGFHLDIEDYLSGVLTLASELVRKIFMHVFGLKLT